MKRFLTVCLLVVILVPSALAMPSGTLPYGVGARFAAMGGAGCALANAAYGAYYNPAGMLQNNFGLDLSAGTAAAGLSDILNVISDFPKPAKFFSDNYNKSVNLSGNADAQLGINIADFGLSVIPVGTINAVKAADNSSGSIGGNGLVEGILTIGRGFYVPSLPFLSSNLNVGANIKYVSSISASSSLNSLTQSTDTSTTNTGTGFDLGLQSSIDTPIMPVNIGIAIKDISESLSGTTNNTTTTYDSSGNITNQTSTISNESSATPTTFVIGAATKIPVINVLVALDLDTVSGSGVAYNVTHIGIEYPIWMGLINLRVGTISGGSSTAPISMTTYGAGILGDTINVAMVSDNNNSQNNQMMFDVGLGF